MRYLLDTNVVSEWARPRPDARVVSWLDEIDEDNVFLSVVTVAEISHGVELQVAGRRQEELEQWLGRDLARRFDGRVLAVDWPIAQAWGRLMAQSRRGGQPLSVMDGFVAATAIAHRLVLATRNTRDFVSFGLELFDPWQA